MKKKIIIIITLLIGFNKTIHSNQFSCDDVLDPKEKIDFNQWMMGLEPVIKEESERLAKIVSGQIIQKLLTNKSKNWLEVEDFISQCSSTLCRIETHTEEFYLSGSVFLSDNISGGLTLNFDIESFKVTVVGKSGKNLIVSYNSRPLGVNYQFIKLIGFIFSGVYNALNNHPEINRVKIIGSQVVSESLIKTLDELGFKKSKVNPTGEQKLYFLYKMYPSTMYGLAMEKYKREFQYDPIGLGLKAVTKIGGITYYLSGQLAHNWELELPLVIDPKITN